MDELSLLSLLTTEISLFVGLRVKRAHFSCSTSFKSCKWELFRDKHSLSIRILNSSKRSTQTYYVRSSRIFLKGVCFDLEEKVESLCWKEGCAKSWETNESSIKHFILKIKYIWESLLLKYSHISKFSIFFWIWVFWKIYKYYQKNI